MQINQTPPILTATENTLLPPDKQKRPRLMVNLRRPDEDNKIFCRVE